MGSASVASAKSQRSSASSVASKQSKRSQRSHHSTTSSKVSSNSKSSLDLQEKLRKIDEKSVSSSNNNGPPTIRSAGNKSASASTHSTRSTSQRSTASSRHSSTSKASSKKSSTPLDAKLDKISELHDASSSSSWRSPYQASSATSASASASVSSWMSTSSKSSATSARSSKTSKTSTTIPMSNTRKDDASVASHRSSSSSRNGNHGNCDSNNFSARGQQAEGIDCLESGNYTQAVGLFTSALQAYDIGNSEGGGGGKERQAVATLYGYRCEALYEVGAYDASVRDARNALELEGQLSQSSGGGNDDVIPSSNKLLHPEKGDVLRAKVLCTLGYSLLRQGNVDGVSDTFRESIRLAKKGLDDSDNLAESERKSSTIHNLAVNGLKQTTDRASKGLSTLAKYESLKTKLETKSYKDKDRIDILDAALEIAPASIEWNLSKVKYYISRRRWFAVANHCEQVAARAARCDGIFRDDLSDANPYPGIPPMQELHHDFFASENNSKNDEGSIPPHLRKLSTKAVRDAVFRLPRELLPYYLRSLRLEERYNAAVLAGTALAEFDSQAKGDDGDNDNFAENRRFHTEWDKLDRTIKLKEEGDALFRDGYYERAVTLYGECLAIDGGGDGSSSSILRQASSYAVASMKANDAGGKLHAVLHSNRAACFSAMERYEDATKESSHAIEVHSMYTKAILRRARSYAKIGQNDKAKSDFNRYIVLVEGARDYPYPPPNQGSACYFDMPSDVSHQQLDAVKSEMSELGISPVGTRPSRSKSRSFTGRKGKPSSKKSLSFLCCKKNVESQVEIRPSHWPSGNGTTRAGEGSEHSATNPKKRISFSSTAQGPTITSRPDPPNSPLIKSRPAFEHPLDPPSVVDANIDYYATLGVPSSASVSDIKQAYHKLAREYHPDRNNSREAEARFQEVKQAYAILGDTKGKKREYDKAKAKMLDP